MKILNIMLSEAEIAMIIGGYCICTYKNQTKIVSNSKYDFINSLEETIGTQNSAKECQNSCEKKGYLNSSCSNYRELSTSPCLSESTDNENYAGRVLFKIIE